MITDNAHLFLGFAECEGCVVTARLIECKDVAARVIRHSHCPLNYINLLSTSIELLLTTDFTDHKQAAVG